VFPHAASDSLPVDDRSLFGILRQSMARFQDDGLNPGKTRPKKPLSRTDCRIAHCGWIGIVLQDGRARKQVNDEGWESFVEAIEQAKGCLMLRVKQGFACGDGAFEQIEYWLVVHRSNRNAEFIPQPKAI